MRYFYDCEFIEDGRTIDLVSIGVAAEDGREFYAISSGIRPGPGGSVGAPQRAAEAPVDGIERMAQPERIRDDLYAFLVPRPTVVPELWAWVAAYDHVALCQLWGV